MIMWFLETFSYCCCYSTPRLPEIEINLSVRELQNSKHLIGVLDTVRSDLNTHGYQNAKTTITLNADVIDQVSFLKNSNPDATSKVVWEADSGLSEISKSKNLSAPSKVLNNTNKNMLVVDQLNVT